MGKRALRKPIDLTLKVIAILLGVTIVCIDDFEVSGIKIVLGMVATEIVVILILNAYGRRK